MQKAAGMGGNDGLAVDLASGTAAGAAQLLVGEQYLRVPCWWDGGLLVHLTLQLLA